MTPNSVQTHSAGTEVEMTQMSMQQPGLGEFSVTNGTRKSGRLCRLLNSPQGVLWAGEGGRLANPTVEIIQFGSLLNNGIICQQVSIQCYPLGPAKDTSFRWDPPRLSGGLGCGKRKRNVTSFSERFRTHALMPEKLYSCFFSKQIVC